MACLIVLWTSGGDRCQDLTTLREDRALAALSGYDLPNRFHGVNFTRVDGYIQAQAPA